MRCVWVRRTNSPIAGPEKARVLGPSTINAPNQPICSARYAPTRSRRCPRAARLQHRGHAAPSRRNRNESHPRRTRRSHSRSSWMARRQRPQGSQKHLAPAAAAACTELNPQENIWQFMRANWLSNRISNPSTKSSITAATRGTRSSINPGKSCPSLAAIGQ